MNKRVDFYFQQRKWTECEPLGTVKVEPHLGEVLSKLVGKSGSSVITLSGYF